MQFLNNLGQHNVDFFCGYGNALEKIQTNPSERLPSKYAMSFGEVVCKIIMQSTHIGLSVRA